MLSKKQKTTDQILKAYGQKEQTQAFKSHVLKSTSYCPLAMRTKTKAAPSDQTGTGRTLKPMAHFLYSYHLFSPQQPLHQVIVTTVLPTHGRESLMPESTAGKAEIQSKSNSSAPSGTPPVTSSAEVNGAGGIWHGTKLQRDPCGEFRTLLPATQVGRGGVSHNTVLALSSSQSRQPRAGTRESAQPHGPAGPITCWRLLDEGAPAGLPMERKDRKGLGWKTEPQMPGSTEQGEPKRGMKAKPPHPQVPPLQVLKKGISQQDQRSGLPPV